MSSSTHRFTSSDKYFYGKETKYDRGGDTCLDCEKPMTVFTMADEFTCTVCFQAEQADYFLDLPTAA